MSTDSQVKELRLEPWAVRVDHILEWQGRDRKWLAGKIDIDPGQFHRLMHGQGGLILHAKHKDAIAAFLGVPPGVIFEEGMAGVLLRMGEIQDLLLRMETALDHEYSDGTVREYREHMREFLATYKMEVQEQKQELTDAEARRLQAVAEEVGRAK